MFLFCAVTMLLFPFPSSALLPCPCVAVLFGCFCGYAAAVTFANNKDLGNAEPLDLTVTTPQLASGQICLASGALFQFEISKWLALM